MLESVSTMYAVDSNELVHIMSDARHQMKDNCSCCASSQCMRRKLQEKGGKKDSLLPLAISHLSMIAETHNLEDV